MTFIAKPNLHHPSLQKNERGYTRRDYEGKVSTLCAGCGHDSISAAIIQAFASSATKSDWMVRFARVPTIAMVMVTMMVSTA